MGTKGWGMYGPGTLQRTDTNYHLLSSYYLLGLVLSALPEFSHLIFTITA